MHLGFLGLVGWFGCASPVEPSPPSPALHSPDAEAWAWAPCDLLAPGDLRAECVTVDLPLDIAKPDGRTLPIAIKRLPAAEPNHEMAIWVLPGGPGQPGVPNLFGRSWLQTYLPQATFYTLDHRGTGESAALTCPDEEAPTSEGGVGVTRNERDACARHVAASHDLSHFTTEAAAADVIALIEATRWPSQRTVVLGASYGTYWASRVAARAPKLVDHVVLEAVIPPDTVFHDFDRTMDETGRDWLRACEASSECRAQFAGPPLQEAFNALVGLREGTHCVDLGVTAEEVRTWAGEFLMSTTTRPLVAPLYARLARCAPSDVEAIEHLFFDVLTIDEPPPSSALQWPLFWHVASNDLWSDGPSSADLDQALETAVAATGRGADIAWFAEGWPRVSVPADRVTIPADVPATLFHGKRDPTSDIDRVRALADAWTESVLIEIPDGAHGLVGATPFDGWGDCTARILVDQLRDPASPVSGCLDTLVPALFAPDAEASDAFFGTSDPWGAP
ncbi:MAG: alpha/beta hydrolase [Myxococcota bacterium]